MKYVTEIWMTDRERDEIKTANPPTVIPGKDGTLKVREDSGKEITYNWNHVIAYSVERREAE